MTLTNSLTETPINSGGMSLLTPATAEAEAAAALEAAADVAAGNDEVDFL